MQAIHEYAELKRRDKSSVLREGRGGGQEGLGREERDKNVAARGKENGVKSEEQIRGYHSCVRALPPFLKTSLARVRVGHDGVIIHTVFFRGIDNLG